MAYLIKPQSFISDQYGAPLAYPKDAEKRRALIEHAKELLKNDGYYCDRCNKVTTRLELVMEKRIAPQFFGLRFCSDLCREQWITRYYFQPKGA